MAMSVSCRPFRARRGPGRHLGFRRSGSTLGYNPTAASRLPSPNERGSVRFSDVVFSCALTVLVGLLHSYPGFRFAPPWAIILPPLRGSRALTGTVLSGARLLCRSFTAKRRRRKERAAQRAA